MQESNSRDPTKRRKGGGGKVDMCMVDRYEGTEGEKKKEIDGEDISPKAVHARARGNMGG